MFTETFTYEGGKFDVVFGEGIARIDNNDHLWAFINTNPGVKTRELVDWMKQVYSSAYGRELKISAHSFVMEIWGHIYFEHFLLRHEGFGRLLFPFGLYERLVKSCEDVDCGESKVDHNRWLWDLLGVFTPLVGRLIPKNSLV